MFFRDKDKILSVIKNIRRHRCCVYISEDFCDCKFGGEDISRLFHGGESNGCPELRVVISLLNKMTDKEYQRILNRKSYYVNSSQKQKRLEKTP